MSASAQLAPQPGIAPRISELSISNDLGASGAGATRPLAAFGKAEACHRAFRIVAGAV